MKCNEFAPIVLRATRLCLFRMPQGNEITTFLATSTIPSATPKINLKKILIFLWTSMKWFPRQNISRSLTCKKAFHPFVKSCQRERAAQRRQGARILVLVPAHFHPSSRERPRHPSGLTSHLENFDHTTKLYLCSNHLQGDSKFLYLERLYRAFSLTGPPVMALYWNKRKLRFLH